MLLYKIIHYFFIKIVIITLKSRKKFIRDDITIIRSDKIQFLFQIKKKKKKENSIDYCYSKEMPFKGTLCTKYREQRLESLT